MNEFIVFFAGILILGLLFAFFAAEKQNNRRNIGTIAALIVTGLCITAIFQEKLQPGIDLAGGSSFTVRIDPKKEDGKPIAVTQDDQKQAISVIRKRLDPKGIKDLAIQGQGTDRITIEMPGVTKKEADKIEGILKEQAVLSFHEVNPQSASIVAQLESGQISRPPPGYIVVPKLLTEDGKPVIDKETGDQASTPVILRRRAIVKGSQIKRAQADFAQPGVVQITLNSEGGKKMRKYTGQVNIGRDAMATILDGKAISVATINAVLSSSFIIEGIDGGYDGAQLLAQQLMNPLENPLDIEEQRQVSARLGETTINQGIWAGVAGLGLTLVFVLLYYRMAGVVALIGLAVNIVILFGAMAMFGFSFTLPGIAGIILTIGVSVDANVLIFERLREELAAGKSVSSAIKNAYEKAFSAILDANVTTLITALILFWRASGTVKGFAVTLTIGIVASMFAALLVTRILFWWFRDAGLIKEKLSFMDLLPKKAVNFMKYGKRAFIISSVLIVASIASTLVRGNNALGIDFAGGALTRFEFKETVLSAEDAKEALSGLDLEKSPQVQQETTAAGNESLAIRSAGGDADKIIAQLRESFPEQLPAEVESSTEFVSAALGKEFLELSLVALGIGLFLVMIYITIRFEFSFAIGAFVALVHDVVICIGVIVMLGGEFSLIHVGAILTIAGYSINDTIVVFDRIREQLQLRSGDIHDIMNEAINATLSRTILTSLTTFVSVMVLAIFGGHAMRDFATAMMAGVIVGTYSSIFVASPMVAWWSKKRGTNLRAEVIDAQLEAQVMPGKG